MATCGKCSSAILNSKEIIICAECKSVFHPTCTRIETIENFKKLRSNQKSNWKCDTCKTESSSASSDTVSQVSVLDSIRRSIQEMNHNLTTKIDKVDGNIEEIKDQVSGVKEEVSAIKGSINDLISENEERKREYKLIKEENQNLKSDIAALKQSVRDLEQYSRRDNIEIVGIPFSKGENVYALLAKIAGLLNVKFNSYDISVAHRLAVTQNYPNPAIIVKFVARECKNAWISGARIHRKKLTGAALSDSWPSYSFYINDHLTSYNKEILGKARKAVKEKKLALAWSSDCKVYAKKDFGPDTRPTPLRTLEDLDQLLSK